MNLQPLLRRVERLEADQNRDWLAGATAFRLAWIDRPAGDTPLAAGQRIEQDFECRRTVRNWRRPGLSFEFGILRERRVAESTGPLEPGPAGRSANESKRGGRHE